VDIKQSLCFFGYIKRSFTISNTLLTEHIKNIFGMSDYMKRPSCTLHTGWAVFHNLLNPELSFYFYF